MSSDGLPYRVFLYDRLKDLLCIIDRKNDYGISEGGYEALLCEEP